jgi:hypothetical protein
VADAGPVTIVATSCRKPEPSEKTTTWRPIGMTYSPQNSSNRFLMKSRAMC